MLRARWIAGFVALLVGCSDGATERQGDGDAGLGSDASTADGPTADASPADGASAAECTVQAQGVTGTSLLYDSYQVSGLSGAECPTQVFISAAHLAEAFPTSEIPPEVLAADFATDRVLLHTANPFVRFVVDDGGALAVGEELLCQGVYPQCMAFVVHGSTRNFVDVVECPYLGPDPCLAP